MAAFATVDDLPVNLTTEEKQAQALERATDYIRSVTGQQLTLGTSTVSLPGNGRRLMQLPQVPVVSVASVTVDGQLLTVDVHFRVDSATGVLMRLGGCWPRYRPVVVTYTHGYASIPDDIKRLCAALAGKIADDLPTAPVQSESESVGTRRVQITYATAAVGTFTAEDQMVLDGYRLRALP